MAALHRVYFADSRHMAEVADHSVHLVVTSPPYWQLKDYGGQGQIGYDDTYEAYIAGLNAVWDECFRALHPGCRLCVNIGDQFARAAYYGRYKIIPIREEIIRHCEGRGLDYMGAVIWQKYTTCNTTGGASIMGSYPYPRNGAIMIDYEFILVFKKQGKAPAVSREVKEAARLSHAQWCEYFAGHWTIPGVRQEEHLAVFPEEIPRRLIRMYSFPGETVLDPFLGSATTIKVAHEEGRIGVGYEINPEFRGVMERRLQVGQGTLFDGMDAPAVEFITPARPAAPSATPPPQAPPGPSLRRQVDPRQWDFGSRIDGRTRSGKLLVAIAQNLASAPDWPDLTEAEKMDRIVQQAVEETGAAPRLVRLGARNALQTVRRFADLVRG